MKIANNVNVRVFCKEGENKNLILEKLKLLLPFDPEKEKIKISEQVARGFGEQTICVIKAELTKERHVNVFLQNLISKLGNEKATLLEQIDSRLDDSLNFFIRLDKDMMLKDRFVLTDSGRCYHVRISVASFPKSREKGLAVLKQMFK